MRSGGGRGAGAHGVDSVVAGESRLYIPSLDGIRCVAFLIVFSSHSVLLGLIPGGFGVTVFFFLSGYLITTLLRLEAEALGGVSLRAFYLRRTLRIFPPAYLFVLVALVFAVIPLPAGGAKAPTVDPLGILAGLGYVTNYFLVLGHGDRLLPSSDVLWSLAVEEHFYLMFPVFYIGLRRFLPGARRQALILALLCGTFLVWRCVLASGLNLQDKVDQFRLTFATDTRIDSILFGCILAVFGNPVLDRPRMDGRLAGVLAAAGAGVILISFLSRDLFFRDTLRYSLQGVALMPLFWCALRFADRWPWTLLNGAWIRRWGVLSYSMYLFHLLAIDQVRARLQAGGLLDGAGHAFRLLAADGVALLLTWGCAEIVNRFIEVPCAKLRRRLSRLG